MGKAEVEAEMTKIKAEFHKIEEYVKDKRAALKSGVNIKDAEDDNDQTKQPNIEEYETWREKFGKLREKWEELNQNLQALRHPLECAEGHPLEYSVWTSMDEKSYRDFHNIKDYEMDHDEDRSAHLKCKECGKAHRCGELDIDTSRSESAWNMS